jgi:hypothetical protein
MGFFNSIKTAFGFGSIHSSETSVDFSSMKIVELRDYAKSQGMKGYTRLRKAELVKRIQEHTST